MWDEIVGYLDALPVSDDVGAPVNPRPRSFQYRAGMPGGGPKTCTLKDLATMAQRAAETFIPERIQACAQYSQARGNRFLSQYLPMAGVTNLALCAKKILVLQDASYRDLVQRAIKFDADFSAMTNGQGWAAYPNSGQIDNIEALQQIGQQLQSDAYLIAATAAAIAQEIAQQNRPQGKLAPRSGGLGLGKFLSFFKGRR